MITKFESRLELICLMILVQSSSAWTNLPKINKLERALIENLKVPTRATWDTVKDASVEFASLSKEYRDDHLKTERMKLLYESVLLPFQEHFGSEEDEGKREKFLDHLFATHKWFWPHYVNQQFVQGDVHPTPACDKLYAVVDGWIEEDERLGAEDFWEGKFELEEIMLTAKEIIEPGLMPFKRNSIAELFNAQILHQAFLKAMKDINDLQVKSVQAMRDIYAGRIEDEKEQMRNEETESDAN